MIEQARQLTPEGNSRESRESGGWVHIHTGTIHVGRGDTDHTSIGGGRVKRRRRCERRGRGKRLRRSVEDHRQLCHLANQRVEANWHGDLLSSAKQRLPEKAPSSLTAD